MLALAANPGQFFGPADMLAAYKNIECSVAGGTAVVSVNKYRNDRKPSPAEGGCQHATRIKDALMGVAKDALSRAGGNKAYVDAFLGKGSPWAISAVLETLVDNSDGFIKKYGNAAKGSPERKCADLLADDNMSWEAALQAVCDEWIGLDCNGFVGNWLRVVQPDFKLTPDDRADNVRAKAKTIRTRIQDFEFWDVMCYARNEHIAVINDRGSTATRFWVCQSAGGGPRMNEFAIVPAGPKTFKLAAPTAQDIGYDFYVVSLW
jgi:hypothetical protein